MINYQDKIDNFNGRILKAIKNVKGKKFIKSLLEFIEKMEIDYKFDIVNKPYGKVEDEKWEFGCYWIECISVGYESSDIEKGNIYIKLKNNKFLKMSYISYT